MARIRRWLTRLPWLALPLALLGPWPLGASEDLVELKINGRRLAIPRAYVARKDDGSIDLVRMSVLWPSLEPLMESNRHLWPPDLPGREVISFILSNDVDDGHAMLRNAIRYDHRFFRRNLQHWRELDTSIRMLAMSFLRGAMD